MPDQVYVVNHAGHDFRKAESYGELVFMTRGYVSLGKNEKSIDRVVGEIVDSIADSHPSDWLLLSGMLLVNGIAVSAWLNKHERVKLLIWDKTHYREYELTEGHLTFLTENAPDDG